MTTQEIDDSGIATALSRGTLPDAPLSMPRQTLEGPRAGETLVRLLRGILSGRRGLET